MKRLFLLLGAVGLSSGLFAQTTTFSYTGSLQTYTVPAGVTSITVDVLGAKGGNGPTASGGLGGRVQGIVPVTPGEILNIYVGQAGMNSLNAPTTYNGGGSAISYAACGTAGSGGGASDIRRSPYSLNDRLVVAGGGGGGGYQGGSGGNGGGLTGQDGVPFPSWPNSGGKGGTPTTGGAAGTACCSCPTYTTAGAFLQGGNGSGDCAGGGGGGGGWYGGGGSCFAGGGGGSSYTGATVTSVIHTQGFQSGNGQIAITPNAISGAALHFDGVNDYVSFPYFAPTADMTIEFFYKSTSTQYGDILAWAGTTSQSIEVMSDASGGISYGEWNGSAWNVYAVSSPVNNNAWHKISIVRTGAPNQVRIYVDGVLSTTAATSALPATNQFSIGMENWASSMIRPMAPGSLDEVRIWRRALCSEEILNNLNCEIPTSATSLEANFHFNQGVAAGNNTGVTSLTDASGNAHTGTLTNFTLNGATSNWIAPGGVVSGVSCGAFTAPSVTVSALSQTNISCNGGANGAASVSATGGSGLTYNWTPGNPTGDGTASVTGLTAGTWTCTVTNSCGGTGTQTFNITQPPVLVVTPASQTNVACFGGTNGAASVSVSGGTTAYSYNWTPGNPTGDGTASVTGLIAGTWTCTVTDANSCTTTQTFSITSPSALVATAASQTNISCFGGANGAASINTPTGGAGGYTYNWTPGNPTGDGTVSVNGLTAGTWTCTVTDANSCTTTQTFNITSPTAIVVTAASQTNISCFGGSNGAASINTPTGGAGGYTYNWTPGNPTGDGTVSVTGLTAGSWTCTVTDANSCAMTQTFNITSPSVINVTAASATYVSCFGGSNGAASINTPTGGAGGYTYNWTPGNPTGDGTVSVTGLTSGTWTCTVTDANSCTATQTFNITQPTQVVASAVSQTNVLCNGASTGAATVSATGGTSGYTYSWSPSGGTAATATGLTAGTYTATVSDGNGCTATQTFSITQPSALSSTTTQTAVSCFGGSNGSASVSVSGGNGSYTYSWSPSGGTGSSASALTAGTYTCTTTDANGCTLSNTFSITSPSALVAGASSQTNVSCNAGNNGEATVGVAGGAGSYTYSWSPSGGTAATASGLTAGVYTVTVTDANSCIATQTFNITQPTPLSATTMQTNVSCNSGSNGDAMVMVSGGTSAYTYSWTPTGGTNATASGLTAGTYTCITTDANGCTITSTVSITEPTALAAASSASSLLCNGDTSTVTVTANGGTSPYTGAGTFSEVAGTYTYTVTDNNGCTTTTTVTITEPTAISTVVASTNVLCNGDSTGSIDLTVTGGTAPYTFNWNSGQFTTEDLTNIPAGSYSGVLTDANGCTDGGTIVISEPAVIAATAVISNPTGCTTNNGSIDLSVAGGSPGYAYVWSTTATTEDVTALDGGNYSVSVTDTNGCVATASFALTEPGAPTVTFAAGLDTVCQSTTAPFTLTGATPVGGVFAGSGMINDTVFDPLMANLGFNVITYTYTDSLGCTGSAIDSILVDVCTGTALNMGTSSFTIFPNPNNGVFTVITTANADMMMYDAQGKLVAAQKVQANVQNQINIENSGMYLITIITADGNRTTQRVAVTK